MRAVTYTRYGGPEGHSMSELPDPAPGPGQVRVRVRAAGLNPYDWHLYRADPWIARSAVGWRGPGRRVLGADVAGVVDALGAGVDSFQVGDAVYGEIGFGSCGEAAVADASRLALKPRSLTFTEAAAVPMGALTALHGLEKARVPAGASVLVLGASGGVGHFAVQIAKALGAGRVVAVCADRNADWVAGLGADRVIAYDREDVRDCGERFDVVFDTVATLPLRRLAPLIASDGVFAPAGALKGSRLLGPAGPMFAAAAAGPWLRRRVALVAARPEGASLERIAAWIDRGEVRPHLGAVYPLEEHMSACIHLETQRVGGKVVLEVG
ncbi:Zinc-type alcohol dehydrogenase-like protein SA1988 [Demequina sediminis]|uniref:Zinc-type alcohol dehydrogenase-like protein SA1988 n=1 Tax=Demequina sediminis TaxID=1930058 RepID=A0ABP9WIX7_9MICO|nr:NAD(P)-dependent alcohol dehydrogenase [Demequina sediminis]